MDELPHELTVDDTGIDIILTQDGKSYIEMRGNVNIKDIKQLNIAIMNFPHYQPDEDEDEHDSENIHFEQWVYEFCQNNTTNNNIPLTLDVEVGCDYERISKCCRPLIQLVNMCRLVEVYCSFD